MLTLVYSAISIAFTPNKFNWRLECKGLSARSYIANILMNYFEAGTHEVTFPARSEEWQGQWPRWKWICCFKVKFDEFSWCESRNWAILPYLHHKPGPRHWADNVPSQSARNARPQIIIAEHTQPVSLFKLMYTFTCPEFGLPAKSPVTFFELRLQLNIWRILSLRITPLQS